MSDTGPGADPRGSSTWDNPSWPSSPTNNGLSPPADEPPNPWSREAAQPDLALGSGPGSAPSTTPEPSPQPAEPPRSDLPAPGFDPVPLPPYQAGASATSYGSPAPSYGPAPGYDPTAIYGAPPPAYGSNPYEVSPYQPAYGMASPYGVVPVSHPQSTTALVFGILGVVFGLSCGIGGLIGIAGIVQGRKARNEIDAQPGRYAGRSQAVAGIVTGIIGVVIAVVIVAVIVLAIAVGVASGEF